MKYLIIALLLISSSLFAADTIVITDDLTVKLNNMVTGSVQDTMANYSTKKAAIELSVSDKIWATLDKEPVKAKNLSERSENQGVQLSNQLKTAIQEAQPK